jgi:hypothetical protein
VRKNKDFSAGPVWDDELNRYLVDITYPDLNRKRKRFKSLKKAQGSWATELPSPPAQPTRSVRRASGFVLTELSDLKRHCRSRLNCLVSKQNRKLLVLRLSEKADIVKTKVT